MPNKTSIREFILLGLADDPEVQAMTAFFMLLTCLLSKGGNLTIILLTLPNVCFKTPMCFFLRNFSFLEISFTTVCIPRFLISIAIRDAAIILKCWHDTNIFCNLPGTTEFFLLTVMSYDRYVAICKPLHYITVMRDRVCNRLVISSWLAGFLVIFPPGVMGLQLDFCDSNIIDHFTCDSSPVLLKACTDTKFLELMAFLLAVFTLMVTLAVMTLSCTLILRTILKIPSAQQRKKAFSMCSSHMIVVPISHGSCIFMYAKTSAQEGVALSKGVVVLNTSVAPNPFIYTLGNQWVKQALKDFTKKKCFQASTNLYEICR
ncbi:olfactory receptor 6C65-like [Manis javanica]|uniref:olfactory receptor 6C65-like n=1 Tax=Manis javanica TaxID=9974 RepID=UPI003C6CC99C